MKNNLRTEFFTTNGDLHFKLNDGCKQDLEETPILLGDEEEIVRDHNFLIIPFTGGAGRSTNLLYFNCDVLDTFFSSHESLPFRCRVCGQ